MVILFAQTAAIHQITEEFPARGDFESTNTTLGSHYVDGRGCGHGTSSSLPMSNELKLSIFDVYYHSVFIINIHQCSSMFIIQYSSSMFIIQYSSSLFIKLIQSIPSQSKEYTGSRQPPLPVNLKDSRKTACPKS